MKTKTLLELLTLGSNLYLMSQDKELMEKLSRIVNDGKDKFDAFMHSDDDSEWDEKTLLEKLAQRAKEVEKQIEEKLEEAATRIYQKLHIAHVHDLEALQKEIEKLKEELAELRSKQQA